MTGIKMQFDVIVVGAGPAGLTAGIRLAEAGWSVAVLDPRVPFEKPCGGGLTPRVWDWLPVDKTAFTTCRDVDRVVLRLDDGHPVEVELPKPLSLLSRQELGAQLLERLTAAGGVFCPYRARDVEDRAGQWHVYAEVANRQMDPIGRWADGQIVKRDSPRPGPPHRPTAELPALTVFRARWLVLADGVYGLSRKRWGHFTAVTDWTRTVGYLIPGTDAAIQIQFWSGWDGYAWVFPRADATSVGLCDTLPGQTGHLFRRLDAWAARLGWDPGSAIQRYGHLIPSPTMAHPWFPLWGDRWVRIGDASGFVDPITREGIFFAVQAGRVLAECILQGTFPSAWATWLEQERWPEWRSAARWRRWFYRPWFLRAMLAATRWRRLYRLLQGVLVGDIPYSKLVEAVL
ncbi:MAG: NAD(P)/FAD-dependent oxidoreductase [Acidobacteria bacterium]|nr:NAD(P)/FAD-dependent oxidoreductase [Acidobacteriota bacterium]MDW7985300.1 NAD(P)/FAD-dependent oxidoreductase [Acidobacteriota bacterium]